MFPRQFSYKEWAVLFSLTAYVLANTGLTAIIKFAVPVLTALYPLAVALIAVSLVTRGRLYGRRSMGILMAFTFAGAVLDTFCTMPLSSALCAALAECVRQHVPLAANGFSWVIFAAAGWLAAVLSGRTK